MFSNQKKSSHKISKSFFGRLTILLAVFFTPFVTFAGVTSLFSDFFKQKVNAETVVVIPETTDNSQTIPLLHAVVNINPNPAIGGSEVAIVGGNALLAQAGPSGTIADIEEARTNGQISTYIVRQGDSLGKIAEIFGVSVNTIVLANNIKGGVLKEGQTLVILPISGVQYKVKKGDTLEKIVAKHKADLEEVLEYNGLTSDAVLSEGDTLMIPDGETAIVTETTTKKPVVRGSNAPTYAGYYMRPISGGVRTQGLHGYNGVDIANVTGTPIYASAGGTVIVAVNGGWNYGYGNYVVISHQNGTQTLYAHASKVLVRVGQKVEQGETIALLGSTGRSTGPHIHFEIRGAKNPF